MKLFLAADKLDRAANFGKNVVKMFYTAGVIFDILETFGDLPPEAAHYRKYSKMKAAYIHNCLKNGETPIAGPLVEEEGETEASDINIPVPQQPDTQAPAGYQPPPQAPGGFQPPPQGYVPPYPPHPGYPEAPPAAAPTLPPAASQM